MGGAATGVNDAIGGCAAMVNIANCPVEEILGNSQRNGDFLTI